MARKQQHALIWGWIAALICCASNGRLLVAQNYQVDQNLGIAPVQEAVSGEDLFRNQSQRPRGIPGSLEAEWLTDSELGMRKLGAGVRVPLLFLRREGGPPPMVSVGFNHTDLNFADDFGLPSDLYEASIGVSGVRKLGDRWAVRSIIGVDFATDGENRSSDAWRFRGGAFAIWDANPQLKLSFGAIALGRDDLPVVPALGAIWVPTPRSRWDLILPKPRLSYLLTDDGQRQNWIYTGVGLDGNTWGYETNAGVDQQLSYGDWRVFVGWEARPSAPVNAPFVLGRKYDAEIGYAFSRDLELDQDAVEVPLNSSFFVRVSTRY